MAWLQLRNGNLTGVSYAGSALPLANISDGVVVVNADTGVEYVFDGKIWIQRVNPLIGPLEALHGTLGDLLRVQRSIQHGIALLVNEDLTLPQDDLEEGENP